MSLTLSRVSSLNMTRYAETFDVFVRHSLEYDQILSAIRTEVQGLPQGFDMLDIGAGTGEVIHALVQSARLVPSLYVAFEPNTAHFKALSGTIRALDLAAFDLRPDPFDADTCLDSRFDFVLFSHSLYWMDDPARVFEHAIGLLKSGGTVMGILQGPYGVHTLLGLFEKRFERLTPMLQNNSFSSHELLAGLRARGLKPKCQMMPTPLDMTGLFDLGREKELSELMSFCLQLEFEELAPDLREEIVDHVQGAMVCMGQQSLWFIPNAVVTVPSAI